MPPSQLLPLVFLFLFNVCLSGRCVLAAESIHKKQFVMEPAPDSDGREKPSNLRHGTNPRALQDAGSCSFTNTILGMNYTDNVSLNVSTFIPPDPNVAAGLNRLVLVVRGVMEVRQKDGNITFRERFPSFFSAFPEAAEPGTIFSLPKVTYDEHAGRFVVVVGQRGGASNLSRIWVAVSKNETPDTTVDWYKSFINTTITIDGSNTFSNLPYLNVDEEAVYITSNLFSFSNFRSAGVRLWVIAKGGAGGFYNGGALSAVIHNPYASGGDARTTVPAHVHGASGVDGLVGTFFASLSTYTDGRIALQIITIFNPVSTSPTFTLQRIPLGFIGQLGQKTMPSASQLGTTALIDAGNGIPETWDAVWRNNKLWIVFAFSPRTGTNKGQATVQWVRLGTSEGLVTFEAQGDLGGEDIAAGTHTYYPSVAVNSQGIVAYGYSASSPTTYAGAYASVGPSDKSYTLKSGLGPYNRTIESSNRWGDYSSISVDPTDGSFWVFNMYADTVGSADSNGDGRWGTVLGRLACVTSPASSPVSPPDEYPCGLLGLSLFCPLTFCGPFGRLLGLCHRTIR